MLSGKRVIPFTAAPWDSSEQRDGLVTFHVWRSYLYVYSLWQKCLPGLKSESLILCVGLTDFVSYVWGSKTQSKQLKSAVGLTATRP